MNFTAKAAVCSGLVNEDDPNLEKIGETEPTQTGVGQWKPVNGKVQLVDVQETTTRSDKRKDSGGPVGLYRP